MATSTHPWMLTGPWYRWAAPGVPEAGRSSKPEIQKYAGFNFAAELLREPQRSLVWKDEDYFHRTVQNPNKPPLADGAAEPGTWLREKTQIRKLYKPTHARNYLVVVELHCDVPGLPSVARSEVSEAGFVVRRLNVRVDNPQVAAQATAALQKVGLAKQQVAYLERNAKGRIRSASGLVLQRQLERPAIKKQHELLDDWSAGKLALDELAAAGAFELETEAWIPDEIDPMRGSWQTLAEATPRTDLAGELFIPLYPLIPDPRETNHTAAGRTVYFGVIPTGGREVEDNGAPRFDDQHLYEIRCFVRRQPHKPGCQGELVWSEPTIGYRIAPDTDPEGTANLPVSISVPSFRDIQAYADRITTGGAGGMRLVMPPDSTMPLTGTFPDAEGGKSAIGQICFIAFILLFMISIFLVFAFLPIIVFLFQLFFLLRLKFCIPPAVSFSLDLAVELKAQLDVQFEVGAAFDLSADVFVDNGITTQAGFSTWVNNQLKIVYGEGDLYDKLKDAPLMTRVQRLIDLRTDFRGSIEPELVADLKLADWGPAAPADSPMAPPLQNGAGKLEYYPVLDPREVFA